MVAARRDGTLDKLMPFLLRVAYAPMQDSV